ncbi:MAG: hypothetical protein HOW73_44080 [Polyangiaceae bacterium]|nr:hypothetical protein [Polyangiaceae bacterium]
MAVGDRIAVPDGPLPIVTVDASVGDVDAWPLRVFDACVAEEPTTIQQRQVRLLRLERERSIEQVLAGRVDDLRVWAAWARNGFSLGVSGSAVHRSVDALVARHLSRLRRHQRLGALQPEWLRDWAAVFRWSSRPPTDEYANAVIREQLRTARPDELVRAACHGFRMHVLALVTRSVGADLFRAAVADYAAGFEAPPEKAARVAELAAGVLRLLVPMSRPLCDRFVELMFSIAEEADLLQAAFGALFDETALLPEWPSQDESREVKALAAVGLNVSLKKWWIVMRSFLMTVSARSTALAMLPASAADPWAPLVDITALGVIPLGARDGRGFALFAPALVD